MALKYLSPELRADRNLVHLACQKQPGALKHVAPEPCPVENVCEKSTQKRRVDWVIVSVYSLKG